MRSLRYESFIVDPDRPIEMQTRLRARNERRYNGAYRNTPEGITRT